MRRRCLIVETTAAVVMTINRDEVLAHGGYALTRAENLNTRLIEENG